MSDQVTDTRPGFFMVENAVIDNYHLKPLEGWLYTVILRYADRKTGESFPGIDTLAKAANMSRSSVIHYTKSLEKKKLIRVDRTIAEIGDNEVNHYWILIASGGSAGDTPPVVQEIHPNKTQLNKSKEKNKDFNAEKESALDAAKIESSQTTPSKEETPTPTPTPAVAQSKDGWAAAVEATREALSFGKAAYSLVGRYTSFLMGRIEPEQKTKRGQQDNGDWYLMQVQPGLRTLEIKAFGLFMATMYKDLPPLRTPAVVSDYVGRFKGDPATYQRFMIHASSPAPEAQRPWMPPPDAEDHSAEVKQAMDALNAKLRGKTA